jgi:hypothetical protein
MNRHLYSVGVCAVLVLSAAISVSAAADMEKSSEEALGIVIRDVLDGQTDGIWVYATRAPLEAGTKICGWHTEHVVRERSWFFFIDDLPGANWHHPCRYVLVDSATGEVTVIQEKNPPHFFNEMEWVIGKPTETPNRPEGSAICPPKQYGTLSTDNLWAVLCAGYLSSWDYRYWHDLSHQYTCLVEVYGYLDDHIYVLLDDGSHPLGLDLDMDGDNDIGYACTEADMDYVLGHLATILGPEDQFFMFVTDHGGSHGGWDVYMCMNDGNEYTPDELDYWMDQMDATNKMFCMEQCYSGGFGPTLMSTNGDNRVLGAACRYNQPSWKCDDEGDFDEFCYYWTSAVRWCYPLSSEEPWECGAPCDADANSDGYISMREAFDWAETYDSRNEDPQYYESSTGIGDVMWLSPPVSGEVIHVPGDAPTIQAGINMAFDSDTVLVADGTYTGSGNRDIDFNGKAIVVMSENGPEATIIDCEGSASNPHRGVWFRNGEGTGSVLKGFTIQNGYADGGWGGGIVAYFASPTIVECWIRGCRADADGGGIQCYGSDATIMGCAFTGNYAGDDGGGISVDWMDASPRIISCTVSGNKANGDGGGICGMRECDLTVENTIVWGNCSNTTGDEVYIRSGSSISFECCDVDSPGVGGTGTVIWVAHNIFVDPLFCDPVSCESAPTIAGDYHISDDSPCAPEEQPICGLIGAFDVGCGGGVIHVPGDAPTIQAGINMASDGDTVLVAHGIYTGFGNRDIDFNGKAIVVMSENGPKATIIDCKGSTSIPHRGVWFRNGEGPGSVLKGFTIQNGYADGGWGGGIVAYFASPTIVECWIRGCRADSDGGGIQCYGSDATIMGCAFTGNYAGDDGGGISVDWMDASPRIISCTVSGNKANGDGGGICGMRECGLTVENTIVWGNCSNTTGDEVYIGSGSSIRFECCDVDSPGVGGTGTVIWVAHNIFVDPLFCDPVSCQRAPTIAGNYHLSKDSPCAPEEQPICWLIGAFDVGCGGGSVIIDPHQ